MTEFETTPIRQNEKTTARFAFIAHWVEPWNWLLWWSDSLHRNPNHAHYWAWLAPLYWPMSLVYLLGRRQYDIVDQFHFNDNIKGQTLLIRNFGWHFFLKRYRNLIRHRIADAVLYAQRNRADVIGLGALTKAEWLTKGGRWIVEELGERLETPVVHGDTLTAAAVVMKAEEAIGGQKLEPLVFITGATSKIGRAVTIELVKRGRHVLMYTKSPKRFETIKAEAGEYGNHITHATSLEDGKDCKLWITGKAVPGGAKVLDKVPLRATVLNFSVPNPISTKHLKKRQDILSQEAGLLAYDPSRTDLKFTMRLRPGVTYACHAGTIVHAAQGWTHHEVSHIDLTDIWKVWSASMEEGFSLLPPEASGTAARNTME